MNADELYLGFAQAVITPEGPVEMVGFGRADELSRGVLEDLYLQLALWRRGGETCVLVCVDHIGFSFDHARLLRQALADALSTDAQHVMLCFSHTHAGPNDSLSPAFFENAVARALACARAALCDMRPVTVRWENGETDAGVNRREGATEMDRRLGVCRARNARTGQTELILLRVTAHANVLKGDNYLISPDYFGLLRRGLSERYHCPVMVAQGASGNAAPMYFASRLNPPDAVGARFVRAETGVNDMAARLSRDAARALDAMTSAGDAQLCAYSRFLSLTADVPDLPCAQRVAREALTYCGIHGEGWLAEVERLNRAGVRAQTENAEVAYLQLGNGCLCGVANEIMCQCALEAVRITGDSRFYFGGYTNGCAGYLPGAAEFDLGGYEVYWCMLTYYMYYGRVYPLRRESATQLVEFAARNAPRG